MTAPSFVQSTSESGNDLGSGSTSTGMTLASNPTSGHAMAVVVGHSNRSGATVTLVDSGGSDVTSQWTLAYTKAGFSATNLDLRIYVRASGGSNDKTVKLKNNTGGNISRFHAALLEWDLAGGTVGNTAENVQTPNAGLAAGPTISYGSGPRVLVQACYNTDAGADMSAASPGTHRERQRLTYELEVSDVLQDMSAGSTSWNITNTGGSASSDTAVVEISGGGGGSTVGGQAIVIL